STITIGCLCGIASSAFQSIGLTLQRKAHILAQSEDQLFIDDLETQPTSKPSNHRKLWIYGLLLFLAANIFGSSVQISTLPLIILSPLQATGLVFNSICASIIINESFTKLSAYGTALVALGATLIASSVIPEPNHTLAVLIRLLHRPQFIIWFVLSLIIVAFLLFAAFWLEKNQNYIALSSSSVSIITGILYGAASSVLSAHALLFAKSAVEVLIRSVLDNDNQFRLLQAWLLPAAFLFLAVTQIYLLNMGLRYCSTSVLYPLVFGCYNLVVIVDGVIYYDQFQRLNWERLLLIISGASVLLVGVTMLSLRL
ncbi:hypothetical protein CANCADRAFT_19233, partial [Tortispora caseinolytica NRRL Y-17796]